MPRRLELNGGQDYIAYRRGSGRTVEIYDILVTSDRRRGIGRRLVDKVIRLLPADTLMLWAMTRRSNAIAREFYVGIGFYEIGQLPEFYLSGETEDERVAVIYGKRLAEANARQGAT